MKLIKIGKKILLTGIVAGICAFALMLSACFSSDTATDPADDANKPQTYTLTVYAVDGENSYTLSFEYGSGGTVSFYDAAYTFYGYYARPNGEGMRLTDETGALTAQFIESMTPAKTSETAYPYVSEKSYTLSFVSALGSAPTPQIHKATESYDLPVLESPGYDFWGWSDEPAGSRAQTNVFPRSYTADITLYAVFNPKIYSIACRCGDEAISERVTYGENFILSYKEKDGFNFKGYFTEEAGGGTQVTDEHGNALARWSIIADGGIELYAKYETAPVYTLTYPNDGLVTHYCVTYTDCGGSGSSPFDIKEYYANQADLKYKTPAYEKTGYYFDGWYTDREFRDSYDFATDITGDLTLYPRFAPIQGYDSNMPYRYLSQINSGSIALNHLNARSVYLVYNCTGETTVTYRLSETTDNGATFFIYNVNTGEELLKSQNVKKSSQTATIFARRGDVLMIGGQLNSNDGGRDLIYSFTDKPTVVPTAKAEIPLSYSAEVTFGNSYSLPVYNRAGYSFVGYYTEENGRGTRLTDSDGRSLTVWDIPNDMTIYAYFVSD